jgi:hypothetical protein
VYVADRLADSNRDPNLVGAGRDWEYLETTLSQLGADRA